MRVVAIPVLCLLVLTGLAVMPTASAAPPTECNGTIGGRQTVGPVTVFASPPCYDVYVDAMSCPLGNGEWTDLKVQNVGVHVYTCSEDPAAASAPPCTCPPPPRCTSITTVGPISEIVSVTVTSDCRVIVAILPRLIACSDPLDGAKAVTAGRITVWLPCGEITACEPPFYCQQANAAEASAVIPPVCIRKQAEVGPVSAEVGQCWAQQVTVDLCSGTGPGVHYFNDDTKVLEARADFCFPHGPPPDLSTSASQPGPCGLQQRCPAPVPMCSGISDDLVAQPSRPVGADVDVASDCHTDVYVKADVMDCLWGEGYNQAASAGPVTVWTWGCRSFETTSVQAPAMADPFPTCIRECTPPVVPDGCDLRAATPTTVGPFLLPFNPQQSIWGSDCDVDVDPIGACAPPSGRTLDAEVLFLDVSLLMCDGGLGDIADGWS